MYINFDNEMIRYTGRWNKINNTTIAATAAGSYFEFAFEGNLALMYFDTETNEAPYPHLWIEIDGETMTETPVDSILRISTKKSGTHTVKVIYKGGVECQHRWYFPLIGMIGFKGIEAEKVSELSADNRKTIEFVGDSITEGVLIDSNEITDNLYKNGQHNRVYQDDVCATYAWLTAEALNLRPFFMGYGAVGVTKSGQGSVPKASEAYPYTFFGHEINYPSADYIVINHGTNDMNADKDVFINGYKALLDVITAKNPNSKVFAVNPFYGVHPGVLKQLVEKYNKENKTEIVYIDASGWVPREPLHPLRDGHIICANNLTAELKKYI